MEERYFEKELDELCDMMENKCTVQNEDPIDILIEIDIVRLCEIYMEYNESIEDDPYGITHKKIYLRLDPIPRIEYYLDTELCIRMIGYIQNNFQTIIERMKIILNKHVREPNIYWLEKILYEYLEAYT